MNARGIVMSISAESQHATVLLFRCLTSFLNIDQLKVLLTTAWSSIDEDTVSNRGRTTYLVQKALA